MFKRKFHQFLYDLKINYIANILYIFCFIILLINLTVLISWNVYIDNIKINGKKYENLVYSKMIQEDNDELLKNYNKIGWFIGGLKVQGYEKIYAVCANDIVFDICSSIPLAKGKIPENEGEAIVMWSMRNQFDLGKTYSLENGIKIKIVGYTIGEYCLSDSYPINYSGQSNGIVFLSNNQDLLNQYTVNCFIYEMNLNEQNKFLENNNDLNYYEPILNFNQLSDKYIKQLDNNNEGIYFMTYLSIVFFMVFYFLDNILNKNLRLQYRGVCYCCGESKKTIINTKFFNFILISLIAILCSWVIVYYSFGTREFLMTYKGLGFSVLIITIVILSITINDYIKLKKLNFSEILNFREN